MNHHDGRRLRRLAFSLFLMVLAVPALGWSRTVEIEATAPLADRTDAAVELAFEGTLDTCVSRATGMGLPRIRFQRVALVGDLLILQIVATDDDALDEDEAAPESESEQTRA